LDEKKFCLLQVLRYKRVVKQTSVICYKSFKFSSKRFFASRSKKVAALRPSSGGPPHHEVKAGNYAKAWQASNSA
jgi:hypothetical protein